MKTPADFIADVTRRLSRSWVSVAVADAEPLWPHAFPLIGSSEKFSNSDVAPLALQAQDWRDWSAVHREVEIHERGRAVGSLVHQLPSHAVVPIIQVAAELCGSEWVSRLDRATDRGTVLRERFPNLTDIAGVLKHTDTYSDVDFELLMQAGEWFTHNSGAGLTPRQVPLEGIHAKWMNTSQRLVAKLSGREDLGLLVKHPSVIHFSYLDPDHLAAGGRRHDSVTVGDSMTPAYTPRVVVISENKDTAVHFPEVPAGVSVQGDGNGLNAIVQVPWIMNAEVLLYWGDMDADGLSILNQLRKSGAPAQSMFMDQASFDTWERFGTNLDKKGVPIRSRSAGDVSFLRHERELYDNLIDPAWSRYRRVEQERIPLSLAQTEVMSRAGL